jgi:hypothetical protein
VKSSARTTATTSAMPEASANRVKSLGVANVADETISRPSAVVEGVSQPALGKPGVESMRPSARIVSAS